MCVRREVYERNTTRFPAETMTNAALFDFFYNFNARGYLSYGLSLVASFGRHHAVGQSLREYDAIFAKKYYQKIAHLKARIKTEKIFQFVDPRGNIISTRALSL